MKSIEIRKKFFDFFKEKKHTQVTSSRLIPAQDPTLLFTNAGMNQFKDVFLGSEKRSYNKAVSIQKCMRAGGKHNDLDNVGFTKRHLTFFEMMGNFSFGNYFKKEAIEFAWEFLTKSMNLPAEKLHVSVFTTDDESYDIWHKAIGVPKEKIHRLGAKENFWQMGDTGPCGPCTEIHLDKNPNSDCKNCDPSCDCGRFLEIWNLVFMQFNRQPDGTDKPLVQTGVDTGMGLERLCCVMQNKESVFETDLFADIIQKTEQLCGLKYSKQDEKTKAAFHVLADHIRASCMLIADGCAPSNDGRGYVLRKIIRRAALFAQKLSTKPIFEKLILTVITTMGSLYPELITNEKIITKIINSEVEKFSTNLIRGQAILEKYCKENENTKIISGKQTFKLYDTYGFPLELTILIGQEKGFSVDSQGFEKEMEKQKAQSGKKDKTKNTFQLDESITTEFTGYNELVTQGSIIKLIQDDRLTDTVETGKTCWIVTDKSPFFIVGGGQVPDKGWITVEGKKVELLEVKHLNASKAIGVKIKTPVNLHIGQKITSEVNKELRVNAMKNHTGTHMLQSALIELFGKQIKQSGSLVHPDYLRFDFTYHENLKPEDIIKVENLVNEKIRDNITVKIHDTTFKKAVEHGALAFFGDKYNPEKVRMVDIDNFSVELCGGTHVNQTGEIGAFKIISNSALSAGHRRIVAVTGIQAMKLFQESFSTVKNLSQEFKVQQHEVLETVQKQKETIKQLQQEIKALKNSQIKNQVPQWTEKVEMVNNIPFLFLKLDNFAIDELRQINNLLQQKKPGFYFLLSQAKNKVLFISSVSKEFSDHLNLKNLSALLKKEHQLNGGGSSALIQGGGAKFDMKLESDLKNWIIDI